MSYHNKEKEDEELKKAANRAAELSLSTTSQPQSPRILGYVKEVEAQNMLPLCQHIAEHFSKQVVLNPERLGRLSDLEQEAVKMAGGDKRARAAAQAVRETFDGRRDELDSIINMLG